MEADFEKDMQAGLVKIVEITSWLMKCLKVEAGRSCSQQETKNEKTVIVIQDTKKVNSIKPRPKGEVELKNIQYRITDGRYIGRKQIKGHIITVYGKTQKECFDKLRTAIDELFNFVPGKKEINSLKHLWQKWYAQEKEPFVSESTKADYTMVLKFLTPLHSRNIKKITKQEIYDLLNKYPNNRSKEKVRLYLNAFLEYYRREGIININPCANVRVKKSNARKTAFTYEQQCKIMEALEGKPLKPIVLLYLITGQRKSEVNFRGIEHDIDFDNRILKALNLKGRNLVKRYKQIQLSQEMITYIMSNLDIIHKYNSEKAYREFFDLLQELHIPGSIVNCRHTFATNCFYLGKPELVISREMGHSRSQITKDIYTDIDYHLDKQKIVKLYNNLYNEI